MLSQTTFDRASHDGGNRIYTSTYTNSASGILNSVYINDGRPRTVTYINNLDGQTLRRREQDSTSSGDPLEIWYRFNGVEMSFVGNNDRTDYDYKTSIEKRTAQAQSTTTPTPTTGRSGPRNSARSGGPPRTCTTAGSRPSPRSSATTTSGA